MDTTDKIEMILEWAMNKGGKPFDTTTIEGIQEYYEINGDYTSNQENAIDNIYDKFKIEKWFENRLKKLTKKKK